MSEWAEARWADAVTAVSLLAVAPASLGGLLLRARPGPVRDTLLETLRDLQPADRPWRKIPQHVSEARLLGGLDLAATLQAGQAVAQTGLLAECDNGIAILAMAERAPRITIAHLASALDRGEVIVEREGLAARSPARFAVVALDEGADDDEFTDQSLSERLAFHLDLHALSIRDLDATGATADRVEAARQRFARVQCPREQIERLCAVAAALGVDSTRSVSHAVHAARAAAALAGRSEVDDSDLELATRLVIAPRATRMPLPEDDEQAAQPEQQEPEPTPDDSDSEQSSADNLEAMEDRLIEAALAALPADLLSRLRISNIGRQQRKAGKSGVQQRSKTRGRPMGAVAGDPRSGAKLSAVATLRAAAPWQALRREASKSEEFEPQRMHIRRDDFRVVRYRDRSENTTVFVVDASGSAALNRLAEAKGAVELLLADCYIRRDQVALIAFRGEEAEVLLPPTRSLVRAKRNLAALPGGGGTPLASALEAAAAMSSQLRRRGGTPSVVFLTDGRGNIARDGTRGREAAAEDLKAAAALFREAGVRGMLIDTSPRPHANAEALARAMDILYLPLPHADASQLRDAVRSQSS